MNKDLEVLEILDKLEECAYAMKDLPMSNWIDLANNEAELDLKIMDWVETTKLELLKGKQALLELKQIKEANPSEALKCLEEMAKYRIEYSEYLMPIKDISEYKTIKQTLLKVQEQEKKLKALEIIKNKEVNVNILISCIIGAIEPLEFYNEKVSTNLKLTQQEFELLKEVLGK